MLSALLSTISAVYSVHATEEVHKLAFNPINSTYCVLDFRCYSYEIRSDDNDYYVQEGENELVPATMASFRIPKGHTSERIIPCKYISVKGVSGNGLCEIKTVPLDQGICDNDVIATRRPRR